MTTKTIERTPAEERKETAAERVTKLEAEPALLQARKQKALADVERLHNEIAAGERTGAAPQTLSTLRNRNKSVPISIESCPPSNATSWSHGPS